MQTHNEIFAVKLRELESQYSCLHSRLELCRCADHQQVRELLRDVLAECRENTRALKRSAQRSRSPAAAELADAQRAYTGRVEDIIRGEMPRLTREARAPEEEEAEAAALCAEYAMDFAVESMRCALAAALTAVDLQMCCEERQGEGEEI